MPRLLIITVLPLLFFSSCKKENGQDSNKRAMEHTLSMASYTATLRDTTLKDPQKMVSKASDFSAYKLHIENPENGYIKNVQTRGYDLEIMYRPISYEVLSGLENFNKEAYTASHREKSKVLSFTIKRVDKQASLSEKNPNFALYIQDDSTGAKLEPVYFLPDRKMGAMETFYCVFDRATVSQMKSNFLHLVWNDLSHTEQHIYYTKRILRKDLII